MNFAGEIIETALVVSNHDIQRPHEGLLQIRPAGTVLIELPLPILERGRRTFRAGTDIGQVVVDGGGE